VVCWAKVLRRTSIEGKIEEHLGRRRKGGEKQEKARPVK